MLRTHCQLHKVRSASLNDSIDGLTLRLGDLCPVVRLNVIKIPPPPSNCRDIVVATSKFLGSLHPAPYALKAPVEGIKVLLSCLATNAKLLGHLWYPHSVDDSYRY